ncbi:phage tail tape measure protein [Dyella marensis]|jgi:lambda family phage tail tape measure protein|uniref:Phage tail tape measure protein, lambda family n=1 Tax=Dyella marensis TaxID=500610 RepID=A0A1I2H5A6_9GAMM|nr:MULTISPECIES: phage tail tape measure protein [Dyella]SFF25364.1 phage tail tape measure protein, lambda family [Dyella marensis]
MADIDSNSLNNFVTALNKASKSLGDMQKAMDATTKSTQSAGKAADGAAKEASKEAAKPSETDKTVSAATQKIKDDFAKDVMAAFNADGKAARTARIKVRDDLYGSLKHGVADTTTAALGDAASTGYRGTNDYVLAFLRGYAKTPGAAPDKAAGAATGAKPGAADATADAGKTEGDIAKSTDFMVGLAEQAGERIRGSLGSMLFDTLDGNFKSVGKSFRTMLRQMAADIAASQISKLAGTALSWIGGAIGSMFGGGSTALPGYSPMAGGSAGNYAASIFFDGPMAAKGMALQSGMPLRAFARGGIVNSPTLFPMATGTGLMGEAGPEAIMPLARGPDGRLGVRGGRSSGGGGVNNQISITVNVGANGNAQSDTQAQSDDAGRQLASMVEGKVKEVMAREQRQGGILWRMQHA